MTPLLALVLGTFASEDLTCIGAGLLVSRGQLAAFPAIAACAIGIYAGDLGLWMTGRVLGARVERRVPGNAWRVLSLRI